MEGGECEHPQITTFECPQQVPAGNTILAPTARWEGLEGPQWEGLEGRREAKAGRRTPPSTPAHQHQGRRATLRPRKCPAPSGSLLGICLLEPPFPGAASDSIYVSARATFGGSRVPK